MERGERAMYRRLADEFRGRIASGAMTPGEKLPTESELMACHSVGRNTVRAAMGLLRDEGLVHTGRGQGTYVTSLPLPYRANVIFSRSAREGSLRDAFQTELEKFGREGSAQLSVEHLAAPKDVAERLGLDVGDPVVARRRLRSVDERPSALDESWFPADVVEGTEIAQPADVERGTLRVLAELGYEVAMRVDRISARMPTPAEAQTLGIASGVPVLLVIATEIAMKDRRPVMAFHQTLPADRHVLIYEVDQDV
jgi:GntR family transcriptional regulator